MTAIVHNNVANGTPATLRSVAAHYHWWLDIFMEDDRTTKELILTLGADYDRCAVEVVQRIKEGERDDDGCVDADYEFEARQLVRAAFAYIEGVTFSVKITAAEDCIKNGVEISEAERLFAAEIRYDLNDKGEIKERPAQIRLTSNIRFAFSLYEKAHGLKPQFDPENDWWSCFKTAIKVRDRLMHPRMPADIDITPQEVISVMKAKVGFDGVLKKYIEIDSA